MVTYDKNEKDLVIPSALGLAGMQDSVCGVTEQEVIEIVESAITDYDTEIQVDLEDIRENVSGNTDDIAALSAATEALEQRVDDISTSALTEQIEALSGSVEDIRSDVETLSGDTDNIRSDVAALSAVTSGIAIDVETAFKSEIELRRDLTSLSGRTSAITVQVAELSATTSGISADVAALSTAMQGKQDALTAGNGIDISGATISVKAGEGLGFSGDTLVVSGGSDAKEDIIIESAVIDNLSYNDRKVLWDELYEKVTAGYKIYLKGGVANKPNNYAVLPLVRYIPETTPETHLGGFFFFTAIDNTGNNDNATYYNVSFGSTGNISGLVGTNSNLQSYSTYSYSLPTASASVLGGVKVGSGLTISSEKLSVKYGDGLGMSGDTLVVSGGTGGGDYLVVDALSAVTSPEEGQMAQVRTKVGELGYVRFYVTDGETYPQDGYWGAIKYGGETRAIYLSGSDFFWDYGDGNANSGWFAGELLGYTYAYRCMRPDRDNTEYPEIHIALPENSPLTVEIWDEGGGEEPQGLTTAVTAETVYDYSVPAVYTNEVWTPLSKVFTQNDFTNSAATAQVIQEVRAMVARGIYPEVHWGNGMLFYEGDVGQWINFKNMFDNTNYRLYISDSIFDDNGFDFRGIRLDGEGIPFPGSVCLYVDPSGDMGHRDASCLFDEAQQYQLAVKGCELDFSAEYGFGSVVYARRITVNDVTTHYWSLIVPTDTDVKKGVWHATDLGDMSSYVLDSWTTL